MFEKEAKERARTLEGCQTLGVYDDDDESYARDLGWNEGEVAGYEEGFKEGAEFGYNKANEWHYVKDGDLPKDNGLLMSKTLNLITKMKGSDCLNLVLGQYNFSTQEFSYQHIVGLIDVIAWKEIVLPELPKEIKQND